MLKKSMMLCALLVSSHSLMGGSPKIFYSSIVQSGTHLIKKCLRLLLKERPEFWLEGKNRLTRKYKGDPQGQLKHDRKLLDSAPQNAFVGGHIPYSKNFAALLNEKRYKILLMVRDPRDQLLSRADKIMRDPKHYPQAADYPSPADYPVLVRDLTHKLPGLYHEFMGWRKERYCYVVRFENLVGPKGGGSAEAQLREIKNIANHLGIPHDDELIRSCAENLYGGTETFHKGQIGRWKKELTNQQKQLVNKVAGKTINGLNYK